MITFFEQNELSWVLSDLPLFWPSAAFRARVDIASGCPEVATGDLRKRLRLHNGSPGAVRLASDAAGGRFPAKSASARDCSPQSMQ